MKSGTFWKLKRGLATCWCKFAWIRKVAGYIEQTGNQNWNDVPQTLQWPRQKDIWFINCKPKSMNSNSNGWKRVHFKINIGGSTYKALHAYWINSFLIFISTCTLIFLQRPKSDRSRREPFLKIIGWKWWESSLPLALILRRIRPRQLK